MWTPQPSSRWLWKKKTKLSENTSQHKLTAPPPPLKPAISLFPSFLPYLLPAVHKKSIVSKKRSSTREVRRTILRRVVAPFLRLIAPFRSQPPPRGRRGWRLREATVPVPASSAMRPARLGRLLLQLRRRITISRTWCYWSVVLLEHR